MDSDRDLRRRNRTTWLVLLIAAFCLPAYCADWPQFRGLHRDGHSPETGLLKKWPEDGLKPLWTVEGLGRGYSSATVARGKLYITGMSVDRDEGFLFAYDLKGGLLWKKSYGPDWNDSYPGSRACPTVDGDRLYLVSGVGKLFCFDAISGDVRWTRDLAKEFGGQSPRCGFVESIFIDSDRLICTPGGKEAAFAALDKNSGKTVWTSVGFGDMPAYCSPILVERGRRQLVTLTARYLSGFDPKTGEVIWKQPFDTTAEDPNHSNSPVYQDGFIYITSGHGKGGRAYELSADGKTTTEKWTDEVINTGHGGIIVDHGYLYSSNAKSHWACLELKTGKVMYETEEVGMASAICAEGLLYCYGEKGTLALAPVNPKALELVSRFKITAGDGPHWAHPVISDGRLYIRHGNVLMAFDIKAN